MGERRDEIRQRVLLAVSEEHSGDEEEGRRIANAAIVALLQALYDTSEPGTTCDRDGLLALCGWLRD